MTRYMQFKVFRDMPRSEEEWNLMANDMPRMLVKMHDANSYILTYIVDEECAFEDVFVVPYGKRGQRIGVAICDTEGASIRTDIVYKRVMRKIDNVANYRGDVTATDGK